MRKMYLLPIVFFGVLSYGQVGINNLTPKSTLDVVSKTTDGSASEGLILPRVTGNALKLAETAAVYGDEQDATLVFVTAPPDPANRTGQTEGMDSRGFYYFDAGSNRWVKVVLSGTSTAAVTQLLCSGATNIGVLEATSPASGVSVTVPYNGGNGGIYSEVIVPSIGVTGLNAVLPSGTLNNGSGTLTFNITGTPSAPGTATFNIDLGGENCGFNLTVQPSSGFTDVVDVIINGQTRQMMTRNLGADPTMDPNVPVQAIMGSYYQFGKKNAGATAYTGSGNISGWSTTLSAIKAWNSGTETNPIKTANDPCPGGFRIPTYAEWDGLRSASTTQPNLGTWSSSSNGMPTNFGSAKVISNNGNTLVFPTAGYRNEGTGALYYRATNGFYWSSLVASGNTALANIMLTTSTGNPLNSGVQGRARGSSVRCISE